jgi:hypothetical protein
MKKLPIGIQSFRDLREGDYLYVDKTELIHRIVVEGRIYYFARPPRFGKTLLLSTLEALFRGQKELFKGLYIYDKWNWSQQYPVINLNFGKYSYDSPTKLKSSLNDFIDTVANEYQVSVSGSSVTGKFIDLLRELHKKTKQRVVVLIDECDAPVIDCLPDVETLTANRQLLHYFYNALKGSEEHTKFVFLSGVSDCIESSPLVSSINVREISTHYRYVSLCGYTHEEFENYFSEYIDNAATHLGKSREELLALIQKWYNGYSWDGKTFVYNPFSTLLFFQKHVFDNYWFSSVLATSQMEFLKKSSCIQYAVEDSIDVGSMPDLEYLNPADVSAISLSFQTGYLTVKNMDHSSNYGTRYTLGMPNDEVKASLPLYLLSAYSNCSADAIRLLISEMQQRINDGDTSGLEQNLRSLLANIPDFPQAEREKYYHSLFLLLMKLLGFDIHIDIIWWIIKHFDAVWQQPELNVVARIKCQLEKKTDKLLTEIMTQIRDNKHHEAYLDRKATLMAIAFNGKEVKCKLEKIKDTV